MTAPEPFRQALKEWAAIEDALAQGRLAVLVRKGGIAERRGDFEVEHRGFWLFPTGWHQNEHELTDAVRGHLGDTPRFPPGEVPLRVFAEVVDAHRVEDLDAALRLEGLHALAQATVRDRFHYRGRPYLHVIVVRARVLPAPHAIRNTPAYDGCVSWVRLDAPVSPADAVPALSDDALEAIRAEVRARLGKAPTPAA